MLAYVGRIHNLNDLKDQDSRPAESPLLRNQTLNNDRKTKRGINTVGTASQTPEATVLEAGVAAGLDHPPLEPLLALLLHLDVCGLRPRRGLRRRALARLLFQAPHEQKVSPLLKGHPTIRVYGIPARILGLARS